MDKNKKTIILEALELIEGKIPACETAFHDGDKDTLEEELAQIECLVHTARLFEERYF